MNILFVSTWFPFPPTNGSELRINALLRELAANHEVTLISFQRQPIREEDLAQAYDVCRDVHLVPWREFNPNSRRAWAGFISSKPRSVIDTHSSAMAQIIRQEVESGAYNVIVCSELAMAAYVDQAGRLPAILEDIELAAFAQQAETAGAVHKRVRRNLMWVKQQAYVRRLLPRFAACTVVSTQEEALLRQVAPDYEPVEMIPNCLNLPDYESVTAQERENSLIFTGAFTYSVNHQAMVWFMNEVYPEIRRRVPDVRVTVTGDHAGLSLPNASDVTFTGYVEDIKPLVAQATISIVPILQGGGTRLKILEAMALGTPVVSTSKGAEGLLTNDGEHLLMANDPQSFAGAVIRLLQDGRLRRQIAGNARQLVARHYNWQTVMPRFVEVVERAASVSAQPV